MSVSRQFSGPLRAVVTAVVAASTVTAGLAWSSPTEAVPSSSAPGSGSADGSRQWGPQGISVNPAPYTLTQPDGSTLRVRRLGDTVTNWVATVKGNQALVEGSDGCWRYAAGLRSRVRWRRRR